MYHKQEFTNVHNALHQLTITATITISHHHTSWKISTVTYDSRLQTTKLEIPSFPHYRVLLHVRHTPQNLPQK